MRTEPECVACLFNMLTRMASQHGLCRNIKEQMIDLEHILSNLAEREFGAFDIDMLKLCLKSARSILVLGDNTGEIFFDRLLLERLPSGPKIIYAVRSSPILNDSLYGDAFDAEIDTLASVIESGSNIPGTVPDLCTEEFKSIYSDADLIISKGQGNFETLSHEKRPIFFLFAVKCDTAAKHVGKPKGTLLAMATDKFAWR